MNKCSLVRSSRLSRPVFYAHSYATASSLNNTMQKRHDLRLVLETVQSQKGIGWFPDYLEIELFLVDRPSLEDATSRLVQGNTTALQASEGQ